ncbi:hypothetical protein RB195_012452 [Necator americanus]|uniref:Uncharacterized protein n=1 Tax=Necator americanus TaxID=51031 RepID=A0ABR1D755_NECAM
MPTEGGATGPPASDWSTGARYLKKGVRRVHPRQTLIEAGATGPMALNCYPHFNSFQPNDKWIIWIKAAAKDGRKVTYALTGELSRIDEFDRVAFDGHTELKNARTFKSYELASNLC